LKNYSKCGTLKQIYFKSIFMKKSQILALTFAGIIIISVFVYFIFFKNNQNNTIENNQIIQTQTKTFEDKKIEEKEIPFNINITYPEITNQENFNKLAKEIIDSEILEFKKNSIGNDNIIREVDPENYAQYPREYELIISYDKGQIDENIASVVFEIYKFEGGAHGASYQIPLNYNLKENKKILLADVFLGQENYAQKISDFCIQELTKQITESQQSTDGTWIKDGAGPIAENFGTFLINEKNITFYFPQYQVAPGAFGGFKVVMPK